MQMFVLIEINKYPSSRTYLPISYHIIKSLYHHGIYCFVLAWFYIPNPTSILYKAKISTDLDRNKDRFPRIAFVSKMQNIDGSLCE